MPHLPRGLFLVLVLLTAGRPMAMDQAGVAADCRRAAQLDGIPEADMPEYMSNCLSQHQALYGTPLDAAGDGGTADAASDGATRERSRGSTTAPAGYGPNWQERIGDMDAPPEYRDW